MNFEFSYNVTDFLIRGLRTNTPNGMLTLCACVTIFVTTFEFLKMYHGINRLCYRPFLICNFCATGTFMPHEGLNLIQSVPPISQMLLERFTDIGLYATEISAGYIIMLVVMTYNGYVAIAVLVGSCLGYFLFGHLLTFYTVRALECRAKCKGCNPNKVEPLRKECQLNRDRNDGSVGNSSRNCQNPAEITDASVVIL